MSRMSRPTRACELKYEIWGIDIVEYRVTPHAGV